MIQKWTWLSWFKKRNWLFNTCVGIHGKHVGLEVEILVYERKCDKIKQAEYIYMHYLLHDLLSPAFRESGGH